MAFTPCSRAKRFMPRMGCSLDPQTACTQAHGSRPTSAAVGQIAFPRSTAVASMRSSLLPTRTSQPSSTNPAAAAAREAPWARARRHASASSRPREVQGTEKTGISACVVPQCRQRTRWISMVVAKWYFA
jgi:hypothetical protein